MTRTAGILIAICAAITAHGVQAEPAAMPATVYPPGAHVTYHPALSNGAMDCLWGFRCEGGPLPLFHYQTQDQLHRTGGWAQFAGVHRHGRMLMAFSLFVSRYDPAPGTGNASWSEQAFHDLRSALGGKGYVLDRRDAALLPATPGGRGLIAVQRLGRQDLVVMALWSGTLEIEGIASYDAQPSSARQTAWSSLALQVHVAFQQGA